MEAGVVLYTMINKRLTGFAETLTGTYGFRCTQQQDVLYDQPVYRFELPGILAGFIPGGSVEVYRPGEASPAPFLPHEVIAIDDSQGNRLAINLHYCFKCGYFTDSIDSTESIEVRAGGRVYHSIGLYKCQTCGHNWKVVGR